jgi:hypothetical protein
LPTILKRRYDAAIAEAELNLRGTAEANFTRIVLAAAYAQTTTATDAAREAELIRRTDPTFDPAAFGSKLLNRGDLEHLRDGFARRTHFRYRGDRHRAGERYYLLDDGAVLIRLRGVFREVLLEQRGTRTVLPNMYSLPSLISQFSPGPPRRLRRA